MQIFCIKQRNHPQNKDLDNHPSKLSAQSTKEQEHMISYTPLRFIPALLSDLHVKNNPMQIVLQFDG